MMDISKALSALNYINSTCHREEWIRIGMAAKSAGLSFDDFHNWSKNDTNYKGEKDCNTVWKSFKELGAITPATLFGLARDRGWQDSKKMHNPSNISHVKIYSSHKEKTSQKHNGEDISAYVLDIWERCIPAVPTHEYILRKQGNPTGLRYYPANIQPLIISKQNVAGYLVVPCWSNNQLQTLQFIPPRSGNKLNLPRASFNDGFFTVGEIGSKIYICEGIGQAWSINKATGCAAIICFGVGRMGAIAKVLRTKYPVGHLVVVSDRGKEKQACEVATSIHAQWIELPEDIPENNDVNDYAIKFGNDALAQLLSQPKTPKMRYEILSGEDVLNTPEMRWLLQGVLPAEGLAALFGASGSGKSFLVLALALAIACGEDFWFGLQVIKARVTYICLEGEAGIGKRIKAWSKYCNKPIPDELRFVTQSFNLLSDDVNDIANAIIYAGGVGGLTIIDTLNRAAPGADENSSVDMGLIIEAAKKLQKLVGGIVLLVHHKDKDAAKGLRGHSSLFTALDGAIEVNQNGSRREWCVAKSKDDVTGNSNPFKLEVVPLGVDNQGNAITSCVALFDGSIDISKKKPSLGRNQKIALEEIDRQLINSVHIGKGDAPAFDKYLNFDEAISLVAERMPTDAKHQKSRAKDAIAGLVERKYLGMKGEWLWRI